MGRRLADESLGETSAIIEIASGVRALRKSLGITMEELARSAGVSRVTLHRIEKGEPNVSFGAVAAVSAALGAPLKLSGLGPANLPQKIALSDYPGLKSLAWQIKPSAELNSAEAWSLYSRNWRHLNQQDLEQKELDLIDQLRSFFEGGR